MKDRIMMDNERKIILFTSAGHFFTHLFELIFPALAIPLMIYLDTSLSSVLKLGFLMYFLYGFAALPWGIIADRIGNRRSLIIFFLGTGISAFAMALSDTEQGIMLSLASIGFFASIYHPAGMALISLGSRRRGHVLGINGAMGNVGMVSAPFIAGLLNLMVGWKMTYFVVGVICFAWGIATIFVSIDEQPVQHVSQYKGLEQRENVSANHMKSFLILCVVITLSGLVYRTTSVVLPAYLELKATFLWNFFQKFDLGNMGGAKTMAATLLASSVYIVSIGGQLMGGRLADKYDLRWLYLLLNCMGVPFIFLMVSGSEHLLVIYAALYVFFTLGMQPVENSLVAVYTPNHWRSTGYGIKFILLFGIGSFAVYIVGWIKNIWSFEAVYVFAGITIISYVLCIGLLIWVSRREK